MKKNPKFISEKLSFGKLILSGVKDYLYIGNCLPGSKVLYKPFLEWLFLENKLELRQHYYVHHLLKKFIVDKLIKLSKDGHLVLTDIGKQKLLNFKFSDFSIEKPKKWDGKFRVIIFDIKVSKNRERTAVRRQLIVWGFLRLQNGVWVHPFECFEVVSLLKEHFGVKSEVVYMTVESIESDSFLRKQFGLI